MTEKILIFLAIFLITIKYSSSSDSLDYRTLKSFNFRQDKSLDYRSGNSYIFNECTSQSSLNDSKEVKTLNGLIKGKCFNVPVSFSNGSKINYDSLTLSLQSVIIDS